MGKGAGNGFQQRFLYEQVLKGRVCAHCIDFGRCEVCYSADPRGCAVLRFLPDLLEIASELDDDRIEPYVRAVRERICTKCGNQAPDGRCPVRENLDCGLDRYLPLVIETLQEVKARISGFFG